MAAFREKCSASPFPIGARRGEIIIWPLDCVGADAAVELGRMTQAQGGHRLLKDPRMSSVFWREIVEADSRLPIRRSSSLRKFNADR
jgi:hypothetical protein